MQGDIGVSANIGNEQLQQYDGLQAGYGSKTHFDI